MNKLIVLAVILVLVTFGCTTESNSNDNNLNLDSNSNIVVDNTNGYSNLNDFAKAKTGDDLKVHYILTVDGEVNQSSYESSPMDIKLGTTSLIKGFEDALFGMKVGDKKTITLSPSEAYGELNTTIVYLDSNVFTGVDKIEQGMTFSNGPQEVLVVSVEDNNIGVLINHPLAGQTLIFEIEMMEIK